MSKRGPEGSVTERTLRSMLRTIAAELRKEMPVEAKLELLRHQERLSKLRNMNRKQKQKVRA